MNVVQVNGEESHIIDEPGIWHGVVDKSLREREYEITAWLKEGIVRDYVNWLDHGRIYFKREEDLTFFMLRWS